MSRIAVGEPAPDFSLVRALGEDPVTLSAQRGSPVVLLFVPLAFSTTCTEELCHVAENWDMWNGLGATVFAISVDSPFANQKWAEEMDARFPVLSDFNKEAARAYGVLQEDFFGLRGVAQRSAFVIGRDGRVAYAWASDDPSVLPPFGEVADAARAL